MAHDIEGFSVEVMTIEQALKLLTDATNSIRADGPTHDAMRLAIATLRIATMPKESEEKK